MEWASGDFVQKQIEKLFSALDFTTTICDVPDDYDSSTPRAIVKEYVSVKSHTFL
jgi:hypothetical protein